MSNTCDIFKYEGSRRYKFTLRNCWASSLLICFTLLTLFLIITPKYMSDSSASSDLKIVYKIKPLSYHVQRVRKTKIRNFTFSGWFKIDNMKRKHKLQANNEMDLSTISNISPFFNLIKINYVFGHFCFYLVSIWINS